jgi:hypothetical protein
VSAILANTICDLAKREERRLTDKPYGNDSKGHEFDVTEKERKEGRKKEKENSSQRMRNYTQGTACRCTSIH